LKIRAAGGEDLQPVIRGGCTMHCERNKSMLDKISNAIDTFNIKQGQWSALLALPLLVVVVYEVIMRYIFNAPTVWGFEATTFLYGVHFILGLAYCDVLGGHVKVDVFTVRLPMKSQSLIGILTNLIFFMPVMIVLTMRLFPLPKENSIPPVGHRRFIRSKP
jgi:TRAP-type mannitol/chloroaromatic compound transport system permease small subunit